MASNKPRIVDQENGTFRVEIETTWPDIALINWTSCGHTHHSRKAAERCLWKWNDFAHDEREKIIRAGKGAYY